MPGLGPRRAGALLDQAGAAYVRGLVLWVRWVGRAAPAVLAAAAAASVAAGLYAATTLGMNTDTADMLSPELSFRRDYDDFKRAFPQLTDMILVVVDGADAEAADDAATRLAAGLRALGDRFQDVFDPAGDPFFLDNGLLYLGVDELSELADRLAEAQPMLATLAADPTLRGLFDVLGEAIDAAAAGETVPEGLAAVLERVEAVVTAQVEGRPGRLSWEALLRGGGDDPGPWRRFLVVQPRLDFSTLQPAAAAIDAIRRLGGEFGIGPADGVRLRLTGPAALAHDELASVRSGAEAAGVLALVLVGVLLFAGLRSPRLVAAVLVTLIAGLVWTAAFAAVAVGRLNLISVAFAVLFIGLAVDFGIHFALRYREEIEAGHDGRAAIERAVAGVGGALTLAGAAAAIGFFSFLPTAYAGVAELGLISGVGMFIALFANFTVLPALLALMPVRRRPVAARRRWAWPGAFVGRHRRAVLIVAAILGLGSLALLPEARFDFNPIRLKDPTAESVRTFLDLMRDERTRPYAAEVVVESQAAAARLAARLTPLAEVERVVTPASFVPERQEEKLGIVADMALFLMPVVAGAAREPPPDAAARGAALAAFRTRLAGLAPEGAGAIGAAAERLSRSLDAFESGARNSDGDLVELERRLLATLPGRLDRLARALRAGPVSLDDLPDGVRDRRVAADGRVRVQVFPAEDITDNEALRRFVGAVRAIVPTATGAPVVILEAGDAVVAAFRLAAAIALAAITVLLAVILRSLRDTLLVLAPLALAAALTGATAAVFGLAFNFANVIVLPLLLGLGVASSTHLVLRQRGAGPGGDVLATSTPRAVLFSALTTVASFGSLAVSSHRGTASMGLLLTIAIAYTLVCALVVLPALLATGRDRS